MPIRLSSAEQAYIQYHARKTAQGQSLLDVRERDLVLWIASRFSGGGSVTLSQIKQRCPDCNLFTASPQELRSLGKGIARASEIFASGERNTPLAAAFTAIGSEFRGGIGGPVESSGMVYNVPISGIRPDGRSWQAHIPVFVPWSATLNSLYELTEAVLDATEWAKYHTISVRV